MAVETLEKKVLRLQYDNGIVDGNQRYKTVSYSNVKNEATAEGMLATSNAINTLSKLEVLRTLDIEESLIEA